MYFLVLCTINVDFFANIKESLRLLGPFVGSSQNKLIQIVTEMTHRDKPWSSLDCYPYIIPLRKSQCKHVACIQALLSGAPNACSLIFFNLSLSSARHLPTFGTWLSFPTLHKHFLSTNPNSSEHHLSSAFHCSFVMCLTVHSRCIIPFL